MHSHILHKPHACHGYTLLEMSIVFLIIGLIAGGIVLGADMIRATGLRTLLSERGELVSAVATFKEKYNGLPGDMRNATSYWGAADSVASTCRTTTSNSTATCNGDNDLKVGADMATAVNESFRFWQQLANSGIIKGQYTGVAGSGGTYHHVGNQNALASKVENMVWGVRNLDAYAGDSIYFMFDYDNLLEVGLENATSEPTAGGGLTPEEAYNLDKKADDGMPASGTIIAGRWDDCTTATSKSNLTATYDTSVTAQNCSLLFVKQF